MVKGDSVNIIIIIRTARRSVGIVKVNTVIIVKRVDSVPCRNDRVLR